MIVIRKEKKCIKISNSNNCSKQNKVIKSNSVERTAIGANKKKYKLEMDSRTVIFIRVYGHCQECEIGEEG